MLQDYLNEAVVNLKSIILYTQQDIDDIKIANNQAIFDRNNLKKQAISDFERNKSNIDQAILDLMNSNKGVDLHDLIDESTEDLLSQLRNSLHELKTINSSYARMVFSVSEFYSSLVELVIPKEKADYKSEVLKSQLLRVQA